MKEIKNKNQKWIVGLLIVLGAVIILFGTMSLTGNSITGNFVFGEPSKDALTYVDSDSSVKTTSNPKFSSAELTKAGMVASPSNVIYDIDYADSCVSGDNKKIKEAFVYRYYSFGYKYKPKVMEVSCPSGYKCEATSNAENFFPQGPAYTAARCVPIKANCIDSDNSDSVVNEDGSITDISIKTAGYAVLVNEFNSVSESCVDEQKGNSIIECYCKDDRIEKATLNCEGVVETKEITLDATNLRYTEKSLTTLSSAYCHIYEPTCEKTGHTTTATNIKNIATKKTDKCDKGYSYIYDCDVDKTIKELKTNCGVVGCNIETYLCNGGSCTDTDITNEVSQKSGWNIYKKGTATAKSTSGTYSASDFCLDKTNLLEVACWQLNGGSLRTFVQKCDQANKICKDGACVAE